MFSTKHIVILIVCILYILITLLLLKRKNPSIKTVIKGLFVIGLISESLKVCTYIVMNEAEYGGYLPKTDLPFHLCSIQIIFMLLLMLSENKKLKRVLLAFMYPSCLIGGIAAMLIPTSSSLSNPVIMVQYFLFHASIVIFALYLIRNHEVSFEMKDFLSAVGMLFAFFFVAVYLNSWVNDYVHNINFMYVVNPPVNGLPYLNKNQGWLVYILRYMILAVTCIALCYLKPILDCIKNKKNRVC